MKHKNQVETLSIAKLNGYSCIHTVLYWTTVLIVPELQIP